MRITEFAEAMGSRVENLRDDFEITGISTLEGAQAGQVSFLSDKKYLPRVAESHAGALITAENLPIENRAYVPLREPWRGVLYLLDHFFPNSRRRWYEGVHPSASVHETARLGENVMIGPNAVIGPHTTIGAETAIGPGCVIGPDCEIGENCTLGATSVLEQGTRIGNNVILQPGAVLGADGFKYEVIDSRWTRIPQVGRVILGDNVEVGSNTCIDRASYTETTIGENTKIDNLVQIAHNAEVGSNCIIVSQSGIAGSTAIGANCILAAQAGIADNLKLGKGTVVLAQSGVKDSHPEGTTLFGTPARPMREAARIIAAESRLPDLISTVTKLTRRIEELEKQLGNRATD